MIITVFVWTPEGTEVYLSGKNGRRPAEGEVNDERKLIDLAGCRLWKADRIYCYPARCKKKKNDS